MSKHKVSEYVHMGQSRDKCIWFACFLKVWYLSNQRQILDRDKRFSLLFNVRTCFRPHPTAYLLGTRGSSLRGGNVVTHLCVVGNLKIRENICRHSVVHKWRPCEPMVRVYFPKGYDTVLQKRLYRLGSQPGSVLDGMSFIISSRTKRTEREALLSPSSTLNSDVENEMELQLFPPSCVYCVHRDRFTFLPFCILCEHAWCCDPQPNEASSLIRSRIFSVLFFQIHCWLQHNN